MRWDRTDPSTGAALTGSYGTTTGPHFDLRHGYDAAGNRTHTERRVYTASAQTYRHDGLHRLEGYETGILQAPPAPGSPGTFAVNANTRYLDRAWDLDALGNPLSIRRDERDDFYKDGVFSAANEIVERKVAATVSNSAFGDGFDNLSETQAAWDPIGTNDSYTVSGGDLEITGVAADTIGTFTEPQAQSLLLLGGGYGPHSANYSVRLPATVTQFTRIGLVFGYRDAANFWFHGVSYDPANSQGKREIVRFTNGSPTVVASSYRSNIVPGSTHNMHFGSLQNYAQIAGLGYTFPEGFPGGRVGLYSDTAGAEFSYASFYPNDHGRPLAGRWDRYEPDAVPTYGIKVTNTDLRRHRPTLLAGPRVGAWGEPFRATFSMTRSGASRNHDRLYFLFGVEDEGIYNQISVAHKSGSAIAPSGSRRGDGSTVTGTQTAANMPTPANPNDLLWVRVESDGTTVTVKAAIDNNGEPSEATWSGTGVSYQSPNFILTGGQVGFRATYGTAYVRSLKLETDHAADGSWTTEYDGDLNQPTGYATQVYEHDAAGNLTYDGTFAYGYDAWNRLTTVTNAYRQPDGTASGGAAQLGSVVQEVAYDGLGRRITKRVLNSADFDATEHYYYSGSGGTSGGGQQVVEIRNGSDLVLKQQIWGLDYIDELIATSVNHNPFAPAASGGQQCDAEYFALHNAQYNVLGLVGVAPQMLDDIIGNGYWGAFFSYATPRAFADAAMSGVIQLDSSGPIPVRLVERYEYTPYGERQVYVTVDNPYGAYGSDPLCLTPVSSSRRLDSGQAFNTVGHQGLSHDEENGLVYNRARYLHPQLARFVQRDPLGYVDGMSLYEYLRSAPTFWLDPTGQATTGSGNPVNMAVLNGALRDLLGKAGQRQLGRIARKHGVSNSVARKIIAAGVALGATCSANVLLEKSILKDRACFGCSACNDQMSCPTLSRNAACWAACSAARHTLDLACFKGGDSGHREQATNARNAAANCTTILIAKKVGGCC